MVESTAQGDGLARNVMYAKFRDDKEAESGYSKELVNIDTDPQYYDNFDTLPEYKQKYETILGAFYQTVEKKKDAPFMGTRQRNPDGSFGEYAW